MAKWRSARASTSPASISFSRAYWRIVSSIRNRVLEPAVDDQEAPIDETRQAVEQLDLVDRAGVVADDPGRRLGRPAAGEDREPPQQSPVVVGQQVPAPVDQRVERLLPRHRRPAATGEEPEPVAEPPRDVVGRHDGHAGRGELDRERDPVETPADLGHGRDVRGRRA